mmetsp:Transcript_40245/g.80669  ORF Transcript_40245/g.80669 Transcript_40245/m.80669 type:complete len:102 (-) Transcript_40245:18-323(-)
MSRGGKRGGKKGAKSVRMSWKREEAGRGWKRGSATVLMLRAYVATSSGMRERWGGKLCYLLCTGAGCEEASDVLLLCSDSWLCFLWLCADCTSPAHGHVIV